MSVRSFRTSSIRTGEKRSKFWDQSTVILNPAFESIATATGTGSSGTITFSSIPNTYQHLQIRAFARVAASTNPRLRFNDDDGNNYARHLLLGTGSAVSVGAGASLTSIENNLRAIDATNVGAVWIIDIHDYALTTKNKTVRMMVGEDQNGSGSIRLGSGLWMNTSRINTVNIVSTQAFTTDSVFALYGIKAAA